MKTALVTTSYLGGDAGEESETRFSKTIKFINYYAHHKLDWDLIVLDNASPKHLTLQVEQHLQACYTPNNCRVVRFLRHYTRPVQNDYKYLWRAVYYLNAILEEYEKVVYMDNDFYVLSDRMFQYIDDLDEGWTTFMYPDGTPETGCHVLVSGCETYERYIREESYHQRNGVRMESHLPAEMNRTMIGDRFGEKAPPSTIEGIDYWAQARLSDIFK